MKLELPFRALPLATCLALVLVLTIHAPASSDNRNSAVENSHGKAERNKRIVLQHVERLRGGGDIDAAMTIVAPDFANHGRTIGPEGLSRILRDIVATFPDWRMEVVEAVAADDTVVIRCLVSGTHLGVGKLPVNGGMLVGVEPTGKRFEGVQHIHWYKLKDGKIVEHRANRDDIAMMRQLNLLPPAPAMILK